jgi:ribosomal protein S18 acetylase RimI-like enzyme/predicted enzyme related to lactoylglutathione lyase
MQLQDFYPIVVTEHLARCRDFYRRWFDLQVVFEASWFVLLASPAGERASLAFMHPGHPSAPPGPEPFRGEGICLEFQVADARAEHERFVRAGAPVALSLRDEPFGQRRFGLFDPAGVWIDVVEQIEPAAGWWDQYAAPVPEAERDVPEARRDAPEGPVVAGGIEIAAAGAVDDELVAAIGRLLPQLAPSSPPPSADALRAIVQAPSNTVLVARDLRDDRRIVGTLTLVVFRTPTAVRAWIEDVVVDEAARGRGVGEALSREGIRRALARGAQTVELTSRPSRDAANRLYRRLGFAPRDTNVYRYRS